MDNGSLVQHAYSVDYMRRMNYTVYGLPPPQIVNNTWLTLLQSLSYVILCVFGFLGNSAVVSLVVHMLLTERTGRVHRWMCYPLLLLSIVDLCVISTLPALALQTVMDNWLLGAAFCRAYQFLESMNRIFTPLILTAASWQLKYSIVHDMRQWQSAYLERMIVIMCLLAVIVSTVFLSPILQYSQLTKHQRLPMVFHKQSFVMVFIYHHCLDSMSKSLHLVYSVVQLVVCGVLPMLVHFTILFTIPNSNHTPNNSSSKFNSVNTEQQTMLSNSDQNRVQYADDSGSRIKRSLVCLGILWSLCHLPNWLAIVLADLDYTQSLISNHHFVLYYCILVFTMLPTLASSVSCLVYNYCLSKLRNPKQYMF